MQRTHDSATAVVVGFEVADFARVQCATSPDIAVPTSHQDAIDRNGPVDDLFRLLSSSVPHFALALNGRTMHIQEG